jgi:hypothetical protein
MATFSMVAAWWLFGVALGADVATWRIERKLRFPVWTIFLEAWALFVTSSYFGW